MAKTKIENKSDLMEKIVSLAKRRGFIFPGSEIYGGLAGTWDYGPAGSLLKKNIKDIWWKEMVQFRDDIVGVDTAIMMNPKAWEASGHIESFTDPLIECKICHQRFRVDKEEEMKKFKDNPEKFLELQKKSMEFIPKTMDLTMKPLLFTFIPFILFFRWLFGGLSSSFK